MGLTSLLLTSDAALLDVVRTTFSAVGVGLEVRADAASAMELTDRRHIDGFVIDCDDVRGATEALATIRNGRSNKLSVVFAVLNGKTSVSAAVEAGANFIVGKPVPELQKTILNACSAANFAATSLVLPRPARSIARREKSWAVRHFP